MKRNEKKEKKEKKGKQKESQRQAEGGWDIIILSPRRGIYITHTVTTATFPSSLGVSDSAKFLYVKIPVILSLAFQRKGL